MGITMISSRSQWKSSFWQCFSFFKFIIVDLCYINFCCTAERHSYTYIYIYTHTFFPSYCLLSCSITCDFFIFLVFKLCESTVCVMIRGGGTSALVQPKTWFALQIKHPVGFRQISKHRWASGHPHVALTIPGVKSCLFKGTFDVWTA